MKHQNKTAKPAGKLNHSNETEGTLTRTRLFRGKREERAIQSPIDRQPALPAGAAKGPYKSWRNALEQLFYQLDTPELRENAHLGEFQAAVLNSPKLAYRPNHIPAEWKSALKSDNPGSDRAALTVLVELVDSFIMAIAHHALPSFTKDNPEFTVAEPSAIRAAIERLECCGLVHLTEWASADGSRSVYIFNLTAKALVPLLKPGL